MKPSASDLRSIGGSCLVEFCGLERNLILIPRFFGFLNFECHLYFELRSRHVDGEGCLMEAYVVWVTEEVTRNKCFATVRHVYGGDGGQRVYVAWIAEGCARNLHIYSRNYYRVSSRM